MLAQVYTGCVRGVDALVVRAEVHISPGLPTFSVVGLAHGSVREGRDRIHAALRSTGLALPNRRVTVNLAPADVRKAGTAFDLPIAVGVLAASGDVPREATEGCAFLGEVGLDGSLRPVPAVLPIAMACRAEGVGALVVPVENVAEAGIVEGLRVHGARSLASVVGHLCGERIIPAADTDPSLLLDGGGGHPDLADVRGQATAKRALEIAAAGRHNLLLVGPPGAGKTMLARRLPGILPPMTLREALEVTAVHSVAGLLAGGALLSARPFRAPHHSVSYAGLAGGGSPPRPGEISLAHHGVLFLDELAEYRRSVLEVLRQPLEEGAIRLARATGAVRFPARFLLVAAMNPCPCGHLGDGSDRCLCDDARVARYRARVSGPLLDRIDLHVELPRVASAELSVGCAGEGSAGVRARVEETRRRRRLRGGRPESGRGAAPATSRGVAPVSSGARRLLERAVDTLGLSARGYHRVLDVARTIADLAGSDEVRVEHAAEAIQYRGLTSGPAGG